MGGCTSRLGGVVDRFNNGRCTSGFGCGVERFNGCLVYQWRWPRGWIHFTAGRCTIGVGRGGWSVLIAERCTSGHGGGCISWPGDVPAASSVGVERFYGRVTDQRCWPWGVDLLAGRCTSGFDRGVGASFKSWDGARRTSVGECESCVQKNRCMGIRHGVLFCLHPFFCCFLLFSTTL